MGEYNSKWNNWQKSNLEITEAAHSAQYQKNKQPNKKVGRSKHLTKEDVQMVNNHVKKMLNIAHY